MLSNRVANQLRLFIVWLLVWFAASSITRGDIFRWDNGQVIPGTEGIVPGLGMNLSERQLEYANLSSIDLTGAGFFASNLTNADIAGANLTNAYFGFSTLTGANLSGSNLTNAGLDNAVLTGANLTASIVTGADFSSITSFTKAQLYSTASYRQKNLQGIGLAAFVTLGDVGPGIDLTGWDLSGQDLRGASFAGSTLTDANLTATDLRGANVGAAGAIVGNAILPDGKVPGLDLVDGNELVVRDDDGLAEPKPVWGWWWQGPRPPIPITVYDHLKVSDAGILRLVFESDPWDSLISFEPGISVQLGATLELDFALDVDVRSQVGRTIRLFDWSGVTPTGTFEIESNYLWDLSHLYMTGEVTLLAIPEPYAVALLLYGLCAFGWFANRNVASGNVAHGPTTVKGLNQ